MLPEVYLPAGIVVTVAGCLYAKLVDAVSVPKLLTGTRIVLLASNLLSYVGLRSTDSKWLVFALIIWYDLLFTFVEVGFWGLASHLFNVRQGKRLFGLIGSGEQVAGAIGGFSVPLVVGLIGTTNLLLVSLIAFGLSVGVLLILVRRFGSSLDESDDEEEVELGTEAPGGKGGIARFFRDRYEVLIIAVTVLSLFAFYFLDMAFYDEAGRQFPGEEDLARFLGTFNGVVQIVSLIILPLLSGRLLGRYGLRFGLLAVPVVVGAGALLLAATGSALGVGAFFLYELMSDHVAIVRGISRLLSQRLRELV